MVDGIGMRDNEEEEGMKEKGEGGSEIRDGKHFIEKEGTF